MGENGNRLLAVLILNDILQMYTSEDPNNVEELLQKYDVTYIYIGDREKSTYGNIPLMDFNDLMKPIFQEGAVTIYERLD